MNRIFPLLSALLTCTALHAEPSPAPAAPDKAKQDALTATAILLPKLDAPLFHTTKTLRPWWIVQHDDGTIEDTMDGIITEEDLVFIEQNAQCTSNYQGAHVMNLCQATAKDHTVEISLSGGMPAYASGITLTLGEKLDFTCTVDAPQVAHQPNLAWVITKKELKLKSNALKPGTRLHGWVSIAFDEIDTATKQKHSYKIEGYFKPIIEGETAAATREAE